MLIKDGTARLGVVLFLCSQVLYILQTFTLEGVFARTMRMAMVFPIQLLDKKVQFIENFVLILMPS